MADAAPQPPTDHEAPERQAFDQWLVLRAKAGDEQALRGLYTRWAAPLRRQAMRLTGDTDAAADASQEAWLAIVRGIDRLHDPACFRRWAYQIVSRKCADWVRQQQRRRATSQPLGDEPEAQSAPNPEGDSHDSLRQTLKRLPSQDRALLAMHYADGMPLAEIAEAMALPLGTVKSRLHYARQRLKRSLEANQQASNHRP